MFEQITKALLGWIFKPGPNGEVAMQVDVFLIVVLIVALAMLYKYKLRPLFKVFDELLPQWRRRAERLDQMIEAHGTVQAGLNELADQLADVYESNTKSEDRLRDIASQLLASEQALTSGTKELHAETQKSLLEWLERAEDRTAERDRQLAIIQSEIRSLSTLLMATSATRYNKPLN